MDNNISYRTGARVNSAFIGEFNKIAAYQLHHHHPFSHPSSTPSSFIRPPIDRSPKPNTGTPQLTGNIRLYEKSRTMSCSKRTLVAEGDDFIMI